MEPVKTFCQTEGHGFLGSKGVRAPATELAAQTSRPGHGGERFDAACAAGGRTRSADGCRGLRQRCRRVHGRKQSTASRTGGAVVAACLLTKEKEYATDDQRRCVLVLVLTDVGRKALAAGTVRRRELVAKTIADWPDADVDTLVALLERLTERCEFQVGR